MDRIRYDTIAEFNVVRNGSDGLKLGYSREKSSPLNFVTLHAKLRYIMPKGRIPLGELVGN